MERKDLTGLLLIERKRFLQTLISRSTGSGNHDGTSFDSLFWTNETFYFTAVPEIGSTAGYLAFALGGLVCFRFGKKSSAKAA